MIKVAIITERADVALGGAERSVFGLAQQLRQFGVKATVLAATGQTDGKNVKVLCNNTAGKRTSQPVFQRALHRHLAENYYDIIHSTLPFNFADVYQPRGGSFTEAIIQNAASYENTAVRLYKRTTHYTNIRRSAWLYAERRIAESYNNTIVAALSQYVKRQFKEHYGLDDKRIVVIPNGVKIEKKVDITQAGKLRGNIFAKLGIIEAHNVAVLLFVANNFRLKGLRPLITAMSEAIKSRTSRDMCLVVAGAGNAGKYQRYAKKLRMGRRIVFVGKLPSIHNALAMSDVAVLPTWYDPSSRYILEALAAGKPVITTEFNGAAEMFVNGRHGRVIDRPDNIKELAKALSFYADKTNAAKAREAIIQDNLQEEISITRCARQIAQLYDSILKAKGEKQ